MSVGFGFTDITLVAGAGTGNWQDINQIAMGSGARTVALDKAPTIYWAVCKTAGGTQGIITVTVTKNAATLASSNALDTSTYRVFGRTHALPQEWQS